MKSLGKQYGLIREWVKTFTRDSSWYITRNQFIKVYDKCECCGTKKELNVHHVMPVRWYPQLELNPFNLITLCRDHHFEYGHYGNWKDWNPYIWEMAKLYREGYKEFESIYRRFNEEGEKPDYRECVKTLRKRSGRSFIPRLSNNKGISYDIR